MKHVISFLIITLISFVSANATKIELKESHDVYKEFLMLSDFFAGIEPEKDQDILEAPAGGDSKHYGHEWVRQLAKNFGLSWIPVHYKGITLTRQEGFARKVKTQELVREYLSEHHSEKMTEDAEVLVDAVSQYFVLKNGASEPKLINFLWVDDQKFVATYDLSGQEKKIRGQLSKVVYAPVLNKKIEAGYIIQKEDLELKAFSEHKVTKYMVKNEGELIGKSLRKKTAVAGDMLSMHDVITPVLIKRGDLITVRVETPTVVISTRGKAQNSAALGQSVQVMNLESKRIVEGIVKDSQTVIIHLAGN
jgi:flagella basal body P-ring formation protein FlgA